MRIYDQNKKKQPMRIVTINLPESYIKAIEKICKIQRILEYEGYTVPEDIDFPSRSEFVRVCVREGLEKYLDFHRKIAGFNGEDLEIILDPVEKYLKENGYNHIKRLEF